MMKAKDGMTRRLSTTPIVSRKAILHPRQPLIGRSLDCDIKVGLLATYSTLSYSGHGAARADEREHRLAAVEHVDDARAAGARGGAGSEADGFEHLRLLGGA